MPLYTETEQRPSWKAANGQTKVRPRWGRTVTDRRARRTPEFATWRQLKRGDTDA